MYRWKIQLMPIRSKAWAGTALLQFLRQLCQQQAFFSLLLLILFLLVLQQLLFSVRSPTQRFLVKKSQLGIPIFFEFKCIQHHRTFLHEKITLYPKEFIILFYCSFPSLQLSSFFLVARGLEWMKYFRHFSARTLYPLTGKAKSQS